MGDKNKDISILSDFLFVRFQLLSDYYAMNDLFNEYLAHITRGEKDNRGFDTWIASIKMFYIQIRTALKKDKKDRTEILNIMEEVMVSDRKLTDQEARKITLGLGDYVFEIGLSDITKEKEDIHNLFNRL